MTDSTWRPAKPGQLTPQLVAPMLPAALCVETSVKRLTHSITVLNGAAAGTTLATVRARVGTAMGIPEAKEGLHG